MKTSSSGFGLVDSMLAMIIIAALALMSVPLFQKVLVAQTHNLAGDRLWSFLSYARQQAMLLNDVVGVCPNSDGVIAEVGKTGQVLRQLWMHQTIEWNSSLGQDHCLQWQPNGRTKGQRGQWLIDGCSMLVVLPSGRIRSILVPHSNPCYTRPDLDEMNL